MPDLPSPEAVEAAAEALAITLSAALPALRAQIIRELAEEATDAEKLAEDALGSLPPDAGWSDRAPLLYTSETMGAIAAWLSARTETKEK